MRSNTWLLILLSVALAFPANLMAADSAVTGSVEVGAATLDLKDNASRVNEYSTHGTEDETSAYGKVTVDAEGQGVAVEVEAEVVGSDDQDYALKLDVARILKLDSSYGQFTHQLDNDQMKYLNAAVPGGNFFGPAMTVAGITANPIAGTGTWWDLGADPTGLLTPDAVPGFVGQGQTTGTWYAFNPAAGVTTQPGTLNGETVLWQQIGRAGLFGENFVVDQDFMIEHREWMNEVSLTIPQLPNVTLKAGYRIQEREGFEQSIGMSKCTSCHITGSAKQIDEETKDFTAGLTGKFGILTVDYTYLDREFRENGADPTRRYDPALSPSPATTYAAGNATFDNRLLYDYEDGLLRYDVTPDSDKESHVIKARFDLPRNLSVTGSYVNASVESLKQDEGAVTNTFDGSVTPIFTLNDKLLETTYDAYGVKAAAKLTDSVRLTLHGKVEELENDNPTVSLFPMGTAAPPNMGGSVPAQTDWTRESVLNRDVLTAGADLAVRLARKSFLKFGYEFQAVDREDAHFGETKSHTFDVTYKTRPVKNLSLRASYEFETIDNPLKNHNAALYDDGTGQSFTTSTIGAITPIGYKIGSGPLYGVDFYDQRSADLSNLPEAVHEAKMASTWSPTANFSTTLALRARLEENDLKKSEWEEQTFSPSLTFWYAPSEKLNLTFLYNYLGQRAESKFCQGWYDG